jgi:hypothetical protein
VGVLLAAPGCSREERDRDDGTTTMSEAPDREGRWRVAKDWLERGGLSDEQRAEIERLQTLGYVGGVNPAPPETGVTVHAPERTHDGLNFYTSGHSPVAILMDMGGNVLHTWEYGFSDVWPDRKYPDPPDAAERWRRAHLFENGDVLAIFEGVGLIKIDKDSRLLWEYSGGAHHDLEVMDDGTIYVLTRDAHLIPRINESQPILEDSITLLDGNGNELHRFSVLEAFENSEYSSVLERMERSGDIFHTNTVEVLDRSLGDELPGFRAGNLLICLRELSVIAVIDPEREVVVWALSGNWKALHQPTLLENGNIMIFDNKGSDGMSRIVEFNPATLEVAWIYRGEPPIPLFSPSCGSNQRLPNGNTLITESDNGRAIEVTPGRETVWEYWNPERAGEMREFIATIFEMIRLPEGFPTDWARGK